MNKLILSTATSLLIHFTLYCQVKIDHVIIATENLSKSMEEFDSMGFNVIHGRPHTKRTGKCLYQIFKWFGDRINDPH